MLNFVRYSLHIVHGFHRYKKPIERDFRAYEIQLEFLLDIHFHEQWHEPFWPDEVRLNRSID